MNTACGGALTQEHPHRVSQVVATQTLTAGGGPESTRAAGTKLRTD